MATTRKARRDAASQKARARRASLARYGKTDVGLTDALLDRGGVQLYDGGLMELVGFDPLLRGLQFQHGRELDPETGMLIDEAPLKPRRMGGAKTMMGGGAALALAALAARNPAGVAQGARGLAETVRRLSQSSNVASAFEKLGNRPEVQATRQAYVTKRANQTARAMARRSRLGTKK